MYTDHDPTCKGTPPHIPHMASIREHVAEFTPNLFHHAGGLVKSLQAKAQPGAREGLAGKLAEVEVELKERRATRFARMLENLQTQSLQPPPKKRKGLVSPIRKPILCGVRTGDYVTCLCSHRSEGLCLACCPRAVTASDDIIILEATEVIEP